MWRFSPQSCQSVSKPRDIKFTSAKLLSAEHPLSPCRLGSRDQVAVILIRCMQRQLHSSQKKSTPLPGPSASSLLLAAHSLDTSMLTPASSSPTFANVQPTLLASLNPPSTADQSGHHRRSAFSLSSNPRRHFSVWWLLLCFYGTAKSCPLLLASLVGEGHTVHLHNPFHRTAAQLNTSLQPLTASVELFRAASICTFPHVRAPLLFAERRRLIAIETFCTGLRCSCGRLSPAQLAAAAHESCSFFIAPQTNSEAVSYSN